MKRKHPREKFLVTALWLGSHFTYIDPLAFSFLCI